MHGWHWREVSLFLRAFQSLLHWEIVVTRGDDAWSFQPDVFGELDEVLLQSPLHDVTHLCGGRLEHGRMDPKAFSRLKK